MDKESVVASLARNKKIAVETMTGQRYIIERILHTNDEKHIHILKPKDRVRCRYHQRHRRKSFR